MSELKQPVEDTDLSACQPLAGSNGTSRHEAVKEKTARMLAALWVKSIPVITERVALVRAAHTALAADALDDATRNQAEQAAHKLAGVLGTFGFPEGTDAARRIEQLLLPGAPLPPATLPQLESDLHTLELLLPAR